MKHLFFTIVLSPLLLSAEIQLTGFDITRYGAKPDGSKCTAAIAAAVEACAAAGGGRVVIPAGRWFTGPIHLKSAVELHLEAGAEVVFSQDPNDYLPAVPTSWEGMECWNYSPLVYAYGCTNVAITGSGTLRAFEGTYRESFWAKWTQEYGARELRRQLYDWGATDYPVEKRRMTEVGKRCLRPHFIQFNRCKDVRLEGFKVRESPFWTIHLFLCYGVTARGLDVVAHGSNNDGIDIEMTRNVLVEKCTFDQGDDTFVLKAGRNRDAWRIGAPTENVEIRDCRMARAHSFFCCGSEISGGIRNISFHDCSVDRAERLCYVKTNRRRGAFVEGIRCANIRAKSCTKIFAVETDVLYEWAAFPDYELKTTRIGDISLKNVCADRADIRLEILGDASLPVRGVRFENVRAGRVRQRDHVVNATGVFLDGKPVPAAKEYSIAAFAATPADATECLRRAIAAAAADGCGCVFVPKGTWLSGPIELKSGVELCLASSASLVFRDDPALYRTKDGAYRAPIRAVGAENVRLSSGYFGKFEARTDGWKAVEPAKRPPLVDIRSCNDVCLEGISLRNSPSDVLVSAGDSSNILVTAVEMVAEVPEEGFVRFGNCTDSTVEHCSVRIGDGRLPVGDLSLKSVGINLP